MSEIRSEVRGAEPGDLPRLAGTLASAFSDDPVFTWLTPPPRREERLRRFFGAMLRTAGRHGAVFTSGDLGCAAVWLPPGGWKTRPTDLVRNTPAMVRCFSRHFPRALGGLSRIEARHPVEEHWYLEFLGTRRELQRRGIGSALIGHMLDRCDAEGLPAYLEASSPENVPFYRRHGFEVREEIPLGGGGPAVWGMWRDPR